VSTRMKTTLDDRFNELKAEGKTALMPFLTCNYPSESRFVQMAARLEDRGADIIEIGIPHSDPLADGPTIKQVSNAVLSNGFKLSSAFRTIEKVALRTAMPLVVMCYYNTILRPGIRRFVDWCRGSSVSGAIIPDLPHEESAEVSEALSDAGIDLICLAAPTTPDRRVRKIAASASGFMYLVSVTGITGARKALPKETGEFVKRARKLSRLPVCVGFGISNGATARAMGEISDGVIVGSALLDRIRRAKSSREADRSVDSFITELRKALDK
jgi:tryptophan synthase alpha chain